MITLQSVWGWQPSLYLFLGGMGSGAFAVLSVLFLIVAIIMGVYLVSFDPSKDPAGDSSLQSATEESIEAALDGVDF